MNKIAIFLVSLFLASCASHKNHESPHVLQLTEQQASEHLEQGYKVMMSGNPQQAISEYFDPVINSYESIYKGKSVYCARTPQETILYLLEAANRNQDAIVVNQNYAQAEFFKAFAYVDLGNTGASEVWLNKAILLSPNNSSYNSELAHLYQVRKDWDKSMELFKKAEMFANSTSPPQVKNFELLRAKRGIAYSLVEQGKLDEGTKIYKECLEIDPTDKKSQMEIKYIENQKKSKI